MNHARAVGYLLRKIHNALEQNRNQHLRRIDLTSSQSEVLRYLFDQKSSPVSQRDIELHFNLKNPTVTGIIKRLREKGFVEATTSPDDGRVKYIRPTEKAHNVQQCMIANMRQMDRKLLQGIDGEQAKQLERLLAQMLQNIS